MEEQRLQQQKELQQQQRNEERPLQALMKSEELQNQMEELLLKSLNSTKTSENDTTFSQGIIYSTIETFDYVPENDKTFDAYYRRYEDVVDVDCKEWLNEKKVRLLLRKLGTTEHSRFVDFYPPKNNKRQWIWNSQKQLNYYLNCLGRTYHFFIRDGNALIYLRTTS